MTELAIIGGTGLTLLNEIVITRQEAWKTPYGEPSAALVFGRFGGKEVIFLARHGNPPTIPPHRVNYRGNIWALKESGVKKIISINSVGGITATMYPGRLVFPNQIIDYTHSRAHTFFEDDLTALTHVDFTEPYCEELRATLISAARKAALAPADSATYGATQGPRLETAREIERMERDGCDVVGMTGMPEAALSRELGLCYAACAVVANWAAGRSHEKITMQAIEANLTAAMENIHRVLANTIPII
ncbi:MAG: S-methyl-5'-thioinosine phosphorylase [Gammaproteobacteria bacterium]|nr:S-methyl-5'-thioinosine phosphorylase [Gammaproteobacteria bacterium]MCI0591705.1 S-methyl-5'-thioinosine phosphorylase [Gammaproteobacteria bacterium]